MKLKVRQVMLSNYYTSKLRLMEVFSIRKAAVEAFAIMCTPFSGKNISKTPAIFKLAQPVEFSIDGLKIKGFRFKPEKPNNRKVLVCHGFDSSSYRFVKYVTLLLKQGFQVFAFDAPGHGQSDGKTINAFIYRNAVLQIEELFGPFDGMMAHSLGALAAALAAEHLNNPAKKFVFISPATEVTTIFKQFYARVSLSKKTKKTFEQLIYENSGHQASWFSVARAIQQISSPVLWIHDTDDLMCPYQDTLPVRQQVSELPHLEFITTNGLGHTRIYLSHEIQNKVINFFAGNN